MSGKKKDTAPDTAWPADAVKRIPVADLIPHARNARTHDDAQVAQIAASVREWGWTVPVLVDDQNTLIAGHGRVLAAEKLGLADVPCMIAAGWSDSKKRAYMIADNKLALNAGWDHETLQVELQDLFDDDEIDLNLLGFADDELAGYGIGVDEADWPDLQDGDRSDIQQKTFTLHAEQLQVVDDALMEARAHAEIDTGLNENSNGNALAYICQKYLDSVNG